MPLKVDRVIAGSVEAQSFTQNGAPFNPGGASGKYRFAQFPETIITRTQFDETLTGKLFDVGGSSLVPIQFSNGNMGYINYNISILPNGIQIWECYDEETANPINGYWVAFKQNDTNPELLEKVGELQMTQQFWDNWYNWTVKDEGDNVVKFVNTNYPNSDSTTLESWITKLTWTGTQLVAEDTYFDFSGNTVLSLYNTLTDNLLTPSSSWSAFWCEWILDDDYYGMALGDDYGWMNYRDPLDSEFRTVGFNVLTGEVRYINPMLYTSGITNFNPSSPLNLFPTTWEPHPKGIVYLLADGNLCDNGNNFSGVTAIWSPLWTDNTTCIYVGIRDQTNGTRLSVNGSYGSSYYWDNESYYFWTYTNTFASNMTVVFNKYHIDNRTITSYSIPYLPSLTETSAGGINSYANNNGLIFEMNNPPTNVLFSNSVWIYLKSEDNKFYPLHFDTYYPSHIFGNKVININTRLTYNYDTLGLPISTYDITF